MIKEELIRRSPIRLFEQSIQGGLKLGEIGIVASQRGVGKTSVLVQLALDKLLQGKKVIHVSFAQQRQNVFAWYEDIFEEFASSKNLEDKDDVKNEIAKNRVLMNFNQGGTTLDMVIKSLRAMISEGGFAADTLVVDGFDFSRVHRDHISKVKEFIAKDMGLSIWCNCTVNGDEPRYDENNIPVLVKDFADLIDVVIVLEPKQDHVELSVSKNRNTPSSENPATRLDPKTLLILEG
ncbi:MAG: AAA family ATPase [Treponema sp.]|nr:AAA family ATPase [Treponema sp.]